MIERVTIQVNQEIRDQIVKHYAPIRKENKGEYILFFGQTDNLTVTIYSSKKDDSFKVFFIGSIALEEAKRWDENAAPSQSKENKALPPTTTTTNI